MSEFVSLVLYYIFVLPNDRLIWFQREIEHLKRGQMQHSNKPGAGIYMHNTWIKDTQEQNKCVLY